MIGPLEEVMARQAADKLRRGEGDPPSVLLRKAQLYRGSSLRRQDPRRVWRLVASEHLYRTMAGIRSPEDVAYAMGIIEEVVISGTIGPWDLSTTYRELDGAEGDFPLRQLAPRSKERF